MLSGLLLLSVCYLPQSEGSRDNEDQGLKASSDCSQC